MKIQNKSTGGIISNNVLKSGARGLMFRKKLKQGESLLLERAQESRLGTSVHMFFVFFPIDVVWLDKELKIVDVAENLLPFTPFRMPKKKAKYILELPSKSAEAKNLKIGGLLKIN